MRFCLFDPVRPSDPVTRVRAVSRPACRGRVREPVERRSKPATLHEIAALLPGRAAPRPFAPAFERHSTMWTADFSWADAAAVASACVLGGMLGSFLNVVAHRVPAGESVVFGRSRCPHCRAPVRPLDNIPIASWFLLRGRCRDCGGAIAARYAAVEAACAAVVAAVTAADIVRGGGMDEIVSGTDWRTTCLIVLHVGLVTTLLAWGLLASDGRPVGRGTFVVTAAIAAAGFFVVSLPDGTWGHAASILEAASVALRAPGPIVVRLLGSGLAWAAGRCCGSAGTGPALALAAGICGWQSVPILTVVTLLIQWSVRWLRGPDDGAARGWFVECVRATSVPFAVVVALAAAGRAD